MPVLSSRPQRDPMSEQVLSADHHFSREIMVDRVGKKAWGGCLDTWFSVCLSCRHVSPLEKRLRLCRHDGPDPNKRIRPSLIPFQREKLDVTASEIDFIFFLSFVSRDFTRIRR
jgi:hypothetical protein